MYTSDSADSAIRSVAQNMAYMAQNSTKFIIIIIINEELSFDTELVSKTISNLKRGKAPDIEGLTAEHLLCSHPALSVFLSRFFQLILLTSYIRIYQVV